MKTKKLAFTLVSMFLFSFVYFSSCTSDVLAPDAASSVSKVKGLTGIPKDSLVSDSLHHGKKPHCDSTGVKPPRPPHDSIIVKHPKPVFDSTVVKHHPKPVFDSIPGDSLKHFHPNGKHGRH